MDEPTIHWSPELSSFDYMMYRADGDVRTRTSLLWIETLDVVPAWDRLHEEIERISRLSLRMRQRVVAPLVPFTAARWVTDPDFDLDYHLRRLALPPPGTFRQLLDTATALWASPLDRGRPLWEMALIEGLDDGDAKAALISKMSHTVVDGVGGMVLERLFRTSMRDPERGAMPPVPIPEDLSPLDLTRHAAARLPGSLLVNSARTASGAVRGIGRAVRHPRAVLGRTTTTVRTLGKLARPGVEPSPLLRRRSLNRHFEALDVSLIAMRNAGKPHGCSVNDAYLAAVSGALRHYHDQLGVPIDTISMAIPISGRVSSDVGQAANQWTGATLAVPVAERDPVKRMRAIRELVLTARTESAMNVMELAASVQAWVPQPLLAGLAATSAGVDVQASNVPGSPGERYIAGAKILRAVPIGPLPGVAIMVTMVSLSGRCFIGVNYDTAAVSDHELFAESLQIGFDEVIAAGEGQPVPARKSTTPPSSTRKRAPAGTRAGRLST